MKCIKAKVSGGEEFSGLLNWHIVSKEKKNPVRTILQQELNFWAASTKLGPQNSN